jgi:hypothetical protein
MKAFQIIKGTDMSMKIRNFADQWWHVIGLITLIITCASIVWGASHWTTVQGNNYNLMDKRVNVLENKTMVIDSLLIAVRGLNEAVNATNDRLDNWEIEHIKLLKIHGIFPEKLYRGSSKH